MTWMDDDGSRSLHPADDAIVSYLVDVTKVQIPLAAGLRAVAEESNRRLARQLEGLADRIEKGESWESMLSDGSNSSSRFVMAAVGQGMASQQVSSVLCELAEWGNQRKTLTRRLWMSLAYPLGLLSFTAAMWLVVRFSFLPLVIESESFDILRSGTAPVRMSMVEQVEVLVMTCLAMLLAWLAMTRVYFGRARWRWYLTTVPVVGTVLQWLGAWEFSAKLRMLVVRGVPMVDSLDILAREMADANYGDVSRRLAQGQREGKSLAEQMQGSTRLPATLVASIAWGESHGRLPDALAMAAEVFRERLKIYLDFLASTLPIALMMGVAVFAVCAATSLVAPMIDAIQILGGL